MHPPVTPQDNWTQPEGSQYLHSSSQHNSAYDTPRLPPPPPLPPFLSLPEFIDKRDWRKIGGKWVLKSEEMHRGPEVTVQDRATGSQRQGYIWGNEWKESSIPAEPRDLSNHRSPSALPPEPPNPTHDYGPLSPPPLPPNGLRNHTQAATPMIDPGGQSHSGYDAWLSQFSSHPEGPLLETVSLPSEWKDHAEAASNTTPPTGTPHRSSRRNNGGHHSSRR